MRILQVFPHSYSENIRGGGILEYVRNISERLAKNHDVTVYATDSGKLPRFEVINGVKVERFSRIAPNYAYFFSLSMLLRLRKSEFDIVHAHCYQAFPAHFSRFAKRKKFVLSSHFHGVGHSSFRNSLLGVGKYFGQETLETADSLVAVSHYEKKLLCQHFDVDPSRITVIPCGVNFNDFRELTRQNHDYKSVLFVGRLEGYKGAQYLIKVLPLLDKNIRLEIVGSGELRENIEKQVKDFHLNDRVTLSENIPKPDLLQKFVNADVFVLPSMYEAYSMVVAEAMVAGTPCIVADTSALSEWIDNKNCFGVKLPMNLTTLAHLITEILDSERPHCQMIHENEKIRDWNTVVKQLQDVYENVN